jgi:hypothetical protein
LVVPLVHARVWAVPAAGDASGVELGAAGARAIVEGFDGDRHAIDLVEVDGGRVEWRDEQTCAGRVAGVGAWTVVCSDQHGTRALSLAGRATWSFELPAVAMTGERVVLARDDGVAEVLDATTGRGLAIAKLPTGGARVLASCGPKPDELYLELPAGKLGRLVDGKLAWSVDIGRIRDVDACGADVALVTTTDEAGRALGLVALARDTGVRLGQVDGVRGVWPSRDGSTRVEVATADGVASWPRDLSGDAHALPLPMLGELVAARGERRLVRANELAAVLLDRRGVRAFVPLTERGAVLGDDHVLAAGTAGELDVPRRFAVPPRWKRPFYLARHDDAGGIGVPTELRDLPADRELDEKAAIGTSLSASDDDLEVAIDADDPRVLYVTSRGTLARVDLDARTWRWSRDAGCRRASVLARDIVACIAGAGVHALGRDGLRRWERPVPGIDQLDGAGDVVLAFAGAHLDVLDARDGHLLSTSASDDGAPVRAAVVAGDHTTLVVTYERGRVVARVPRAAMVPAWSLAIDGIVRDLAAAGDGVIVALADGDAYQIAVRDGRVVALPGLGLAWHGGRDAIVAETSGEPTPPARMPEVPPVVAKSAPRYEHPENPPPIATPWTVEQRGSPAWQLAIYEPWGSLRARADYPLGVARLAPARAPGAPLVVLDEVSRKALVLDPRTAAPLRRVELPRDVRATAVFSTVIGGEAIAGVVLTGPLRVVTF